jgi:hypothetical protein
MAVDFEDFADWLGVTEGTQVTFLGEWSGVGTPDPTFTCVFLLEGTDPSTGRAWYVGDLEPDRSTELMRVLGDRGADVELSDGFAWAHLSPHDPRECWGEVYLFRHDSELTGGPGGSVFDAVRRIGAREVCECGEPPGCGLRVWFVLRVMPRQELEVSGGLSGDVRGPHVIRYPACRACHQAWHEMLEEAAGVAGGA